MSSAETHSELIILGQNDDLSVQIIRSKTIQSPESHSVTEESRITGNGTLQPLQSRIQNLRNVVASSAAIPVYKQCCSLVGARQPLTARKRVRLIDWQSEHLSKSRRLSKTRMMKVFPIEAVVQQGDGAKEGEIGSPFPQLVDSTPTDYSTGCVRWDDNSRIRASSAVSGVMCL